MPSAKEQAEELKKKGNEYFKMEKIGAAIDAYTEAIALSPSVVAYWTNRALCHKRRNDWGKVKNDCEKALELDKKSFKALRLLGSACLHLQHYPEAVRALKRALEVGAQQGWDDIFDIERELLRAKYEEWCLDAAERREKQGKLKDHLWVLLAEDHKRRLESSKAEPDSKRASKEPASLPRQATNREEDGSCLDGDMFAREAFEDGEQALEAEHLQLLNTLENVFDAAEAAYVPREVPDFLCCKITMDLFRDPVVTPSGITYEKSVLLEHLARGRNFDPLTRAPLNEAQLVPNLAMKEVVSDFLEKNGWAHLSVYQPSPVASCAK